MPEFVYWILAVGLVVAGPYVAFRMLAAAHHDVGAAYLACYLWAIGFGLLALALVARLALWVLT